MGSKIVMSWTDWRGREVTRDVNQLIDVRDFLGTPGYALLLVAANPHLSGGDLVRYLLHVGVGRTRNWIYRRLWLFRQPGTDRGATNANADGRDEQAIRVMREYPRLSVRKMAAKLKDHGITRGREWVRQHRCD